MAQYRKKPVVIEAFKYGIDPRPDWFNDKVTTNEIITFISLEDSSVYYCEIKTLEGIMKGEHGDYIIQGVKGEIYPCKNDIFEMTYEPMNKLDLNKLEEKLDTALENETSESLNSWLKEKRETIDEEQPKIEVVYDKNITSFQVIEYWERTPLLRWNKRNNLFGSKKVLQQMWQSNKGKQKWKDVPEED